MKKEKYLEQIRNIGIIAHIDAGKTTLSERILFYTQKIHRMGEVHEGTATMDYLPQEQERGITIVSACTTLEWKKKTINLIDTPGHVDFTIEVERALRVLDGVVAVFCGVGGVEPQSETVWHQSETYSIPKIAFINKMDRLGANFDFVLESMRDKLNANYVVIQAPWGSGEEFKGVFDILQQKKVVFNVQDQGRSFEYLDLNSEEKEYVDRYRNDLLEKLADLDDSIMIKYVEGEDIELAEIKSALRKFTLKGKVVPVLAGSALKNIGIQPVLDAIVDFLPSPLDVPQLEGIDPRTKEKKSFPISAKAPLSALVFKVSMETGRKLVLTRLYSGELKPGQNIYNVTQKKQERVARIFRLHANHKEKLERAKAGEIVALAGLKLARTGDTLALAEEPILLEKIGEYKPVISIALEPKNSEHEEKLEEVLQKLLQEDPTLKVERDENTDQIILSGMGELHLDVVMDRIRREYGVEFRSGRPQVVYLETITKKAEAVGEFAKELGEEFHYGWVKVIIEPRERKSGVKIVCEIDQNEYSSDIIESVVQGVEDALQSGTIKGYPVQDILVRIKELQLQSGGSPVGFRMAAVKAVKNALEKALPILLEPIVWVEIYTPEEFVGECVNLISSKGGRIENMYERRGQRIIQCLAALARMFGCSTDLRSVTQGRASVMMKFHSFDVLNKS
ncbi:elongation factor G [Desulfonauticus submarinus]